MYTAKKAIFWPLRSVNCGTDPPRGSISKACNGLHKHLLTKLSDFNMERGVPLLDSSVRLEARLLQLFHHTFGGGCQRVSLPLAKMRTSKNIWQLAIMVAHPKSVILTTLK